MILDPDSFSSRPQERVLFWGWLGAALFSLSALNGIHSLIKPTELVLTPEGFEVRGRKTGPMIPWSAVERFFVTEVYRTKLVSYDFTPGGKPKRQGVGSMLRMFGNGHERIPPHLDQGPEEVCELLESWRLRHGTA